MCTELVVLVVYTVQACNQIREMGSVTRKQKYSKQSVTLSCRKAMNSRWNKPAVLLQEIVSSMITASVTHSESN